MKSQSMKLKVPFVRLDLQYKKFKKEIDSAFIKVATSGNYILGPNTEKFEHELANLCKTKYAVTVANGTDALIIAMRVLGITYGDEIITAPNSFIASAGAIRAIGAVPIFADVRDDHNIDPNEIEKNITNKTKAIMPVHLTGRPADMDNIKRIAKKYELFVIEDSAQAIGAKLNGNPTGSLGDIGCFSLHPLKNLFVMGDGGFITLSCPWLYEKILALRNHGLINRDESITFGYNSRLDEIHCAIGLEKLKSFDTTTKRFIDIANRYRNGLKNTVDCPVDKKNEMAVYHNFVITTKKRDALKKFLENNGVETKIHYPILIPNQPSSRMGIDENHSFPIAEKLNKTQLSLPIYPELENKQIDYVIEKIREFYVN
jgi:dTDP-4-amino-4,6-dideoxygalactose transaminase